MVALHKVDLGYKKIYKKIANTQKLNYSTVASHTGVFQDGFHLEQAAQGSSSVLVLCVRCRTWL